MATPMKSSPLRPSFLLLAALFTLVWLPSAARAEDPAAKTPLPTATPQSQDVLPERLAALRGAMQKFVDEGRHAGVGYVLARGGRIVEWQTLGVRDLKTGKPFGAIRSAGSIR